MKKAAIITFIDSDNFGAILQAFALEHTVKKLSFEPQFVSLKNMNKEPFNFKSFIRKLVYFDRTIGYCKRKRKISLFRKKEFYIYKTKIDDNNASILNKDYDYFIVGSDQVWNLNFNNNSVFLLDFAYPTKVKISYAASFGYSSIPEVFIEKTKKSLSKFDYISVRENTGLSIVRELTSKNDSVRVLDPTLLLDEQEWGLLSARPKRKINTPFILLYCVLTQENLLDYAINLAKIKGMQLVIINNKTEFKVKNAVNIYDCGIEEFLWYFQHASYILTTSFHGLSFAINFNKQFLLETPKSSVNDRINTLISLLSLQKRNINNHIDIDEPIDWQKIKKILLKEREKSILFLTDALSS